MTTPARPTLRDTILGTRHADHHPLAISEHPHAPHAPRFLLARADAREHGHRVRPDLSGVRAGWPKPAPAGGLDAGRGARLGRSAPEGCRRMREPGHSGH